MVQTVREKRYRAKECMKRAVILEGKEHAVKVVIIESDDNSQVPPCGMNRRALNSELPTTE